MKALDGVSFSVAPGEVVAVVGESGCGKSTLGRLAIRLLEPTAGTIRLAGRDITYVPINALQDLRQTAQIVFQDPFGSLNPRMTVGASIGYPLAVSGNTARKEIERRVIEALERVGLHAAHARRLPHELSGGQRQRVGIARAIIVNPKIVVLDEPVAALDLSAQARVLNLFKELQHGMGMAYLFITHDLSVAQYMADRIIVMYAGKIVEMGRRAALFAHPRHPYTQALLSAALLDGQAGEEMVLEGDPPSPIEPPSGCRFHTRCVYATSLCQHEEPELVETGGSHPAACHLLTDRIKRTTRPSSRPLAVGV